MHDFLRWLEQWRLTALLLAGVIAGGAQAATAADAAFDLTGSMHREVFLDGKVFAAATNNFAVQVRGNIVRIRSWNIPANGAVKIKDYEFITDGAESRVITTLDVTPESVVASQQPGGTKLFNEFVDVTTNAFPPNDRGYFGPIWLATASAGALRAQGPDAGKIHPSLFMTPDWPEFESEQVNAAWTLATEPPGLPERLVEYADAKVFDVVGNFYTRWQKQSFPPAYKTGYTNAIFEVLNWTNVAGLRLPQHFKMTGYIPQFAGTDPRQLQMQSAYDAVVESVNVTALSPVTLPDRFAAWSRVGEHRYGTIRGQQIIYTSKTGELLSQDEILKNIGHLDAVVKNAEATQKSRRTTVMLVLGALVLLPLFAWGLGFFRRSAPQT